MSGTTIKVTTACAVAVPSLSGGAPESEIYVVRGAHKSGEKLVILRQNGSLLGVFLETLWRQ